MPSIPHLPTRKALSTKEEEEDDEISMAHAAVPWLVGSLAAFERDVHLHKSLWAFRTGQAPAVGSGACQVQAISDFVKVHQTSGREKKLSAGFAGCRALTDLGEASHSGSQRCVRCVGRIWNHLHNVSPVGEWDPGTSTHCCSFGTYKKRSGGSVLCRVTVVDDDFARVSKFAVPPVFFSVSLARFVLTVGGRPSQRNVRIPSLWVPRPHAVDGIFFSNVSNGGDEFNPVSAVKVEVVSDVNFDFKEAAVSWAEASAMKHNCILTGVTVRMEADVDNMPRPVPSVRAKYLQRRHRCEAIRLNSRDLEYQSLSISVYKGRLRYEPLARKSKTAGVQRSSERLTLVTCLLEASTRPFIVRSEIWTPTAQALHLIGRRLRELLKLLRLLHMILAEQEWRTLAPTIVLAGKSKPRVPEPDRGRD
ncbi:hypothetical protein KC356_g16 [Hortaea werneckii]|nr:hypothetical protein KC356_g16 [Hortaea werneckii]